LAAVSFPERIFLTSSKVISPIASQINPSTPQHKCWGLPSTRAQAEGLRVDPERRFFTPPSKAGLGAAEGVNKNSQNLETRLIAKAAIL